MTIATLADAEQILVGREDAARLLSLSVAELDNERRAGHLIARKHGRKVLFPLDELRRWAASLPADEIR